MRKDLLPWYLQNIIIRGFEGEDDSSDSDDKDDQSDDDDQDDDKGDQGDKGQGNDGLKSALRKERLQRRQFEKELKELKRHREEQDTKDKTEVDKAKDAAAKEKLRAEKLATRLRENAVDNEIIKLGTKLKFRDLDDALKLINREEIDVEQDEDDPSEVQVDTQSVEEALKALAKAKPHLLVTEGDGQKSGSKFGGGQKSQDQLDEEALLARYPALRRGSLPSANNNNS